MVLPRFLTELKRRNVYRAALVYAGVGWVLLEFADVAFPRLGLPDWTVNFVLALVLFGFPFAVVFAWIFDLNTQGIVRTEPISPLSAPSFLHRKYYRVCSYLCAGDYRGLPLRGQTIAPK
jgi:hypothetical protein